MNVSEVGVVMGVNFWFLCNFVELFDLKIGVKFVDENLVMCCGMELEFEVWVVV